MCFSLPIPIKVSYWLLMETSGPSSGVVNAELGGCTDGIPSARALALEGGSPPAAVTNTASASLLP